jgi:hypothetical protein
MARVYLESSFISYLTAAPRESRDPIAAAHQQITIEWWSRRRADFDLVVSQVVVDDLPRIADLCEDLGLMLPIICTPEEPLGDTYAH